MDTPNSSPVIYSPESDKILRAIADVRHELDAVARGSWNEFFKTHYADLNAVYAAIDDRLYQAGILPLQVPTDDEPGVVRLVTRLVHLESGQWVEGVVRMKPKDAADPQKVGTCLSYARRYALLTMLGLRTKDDDGQAASQEPKGTGTEAVKSRLAKPAAPARDFDYQAWRARMQKAASEDELRRVAQEGQGAPLDDAERYEAEQTFQERLSAIRRG